MKHNLSFFFVLFLDEKFLHNFTNSVFRVDLHHLPEQLNLNWTFIMYLYPSVTRTVKFKLETYRSLLYHKQSGVWGIVSEKNRDFVRADCFSKSHTVPIYYTKDKRTW